MTDEIDELHNILRIKEEHIVTGVFDGGHHDAEGWVKATIDGFERADNGNLILIVRQPWGEGVWFEWKEDEVYGEGLNIFCDAYGVAPSEFERLIGRDIWIQLLSINSNDGDVKSDNRLTVKKAKLGPDYPKVFALKCFLMLAFIAIVFAGGVFLV